MGCLLINGCEFCINYINGIDFSLDVVLLIIVIMLVNVCNILLGYYDV